MDSDGGWPTDKLTALRLGRILVAEVPASAAGRRGFVSIRPAKEPEDATAEVDGWTRSSRSRAFVVDHWEYDEEWLNTWDYDIGAVHLFRDEAATEADLDQVLARRGVRPGDFDYHWRTAAP